jgi:hypothetical protein
MKILFAAILLSCAAMAQNDAAIEKAKSACGPGQIHFDVDATNYTESIAPPTNGKAFVFVIAQSNNTVRIGLNGAWVGAVEDDSHMSFPVDPGEHHLCASRQSFFSKGMPRSHFPVLPLKPARFTTSGSAPQVRATPLFFWT